MIFVTDIVAPALWIKKRSLGRFNGLCKNIELLVSTRVPLKPDISTPNAVFFPFTPPGKSSGLGEEMSEGAGTENHLGGTSEYM